MLCLKLIAIGALGAMLSPSAKHLKDSHLAHYIRILDTRQRNALKAERRQAWQAYGAQVVANIKALVGDGDFDGIVICAGKNGDDYEIVTQLIPLLKSTNSSRSYFILHFSTVSCDFVKATNDYCQKYHIHYLNYPLTGGVKGAQTARMLILCSGDKMLYAKLKPFLEHIGVPHYFNEDIAYAAAVKLISHVMVFHGLLGISLANVLYKNISQLPQFQADQVAFFDFLNNGAGGTKQWEFALRQALSQDDWQTGFSLRYAVIDLLYTIQLLLSQQLPKLLVLPLLEIALLFIYLLKNIPEKNLATQAIASLIANTPPAEIDGFLREHLSLDIKRSLQACIDLLPADLQKSLMLEVHYPTTTALVQTIASKTTRQNHKNPRPKQCARDKDTEKPLNRNKLTLQSLKPEK